jgi:hypothetical protein
MSTYRQTRNIEASVCDYITAQLTADGWSGVRVELDFAEAYKEPLPCIVVNADNNPDKRLEVGSDTLSHFYTLEFRIFATSGGQRKDLSDWLRDKVFGGIPYYTYVITNGAVSTKTLAGRLSILNMIQNRKELNNIEKLSKYDRYRQLLSFSIRIALI